jgi:hypothetical protein
MKLEDLLESKRDTILKKWLELTLATYPPVTSRFLGAEKDRFLNPVGFTIAEEMGHLIDEILGGMEPGRIRRAMEAVTRIRAVQDLEPSVAVCFPFLLKNIVRNEFLLCGPQWGTSERDDALKGLLDLESKIDAVVAVAFDMYMESREKICELRLRGDRGQK